MNPRQHRVEAFCNWLDTIPPGRPYRQQPGFRMLFGDLTVEEIAKAAEVMRERALSDLAEAHALEAEGRAKEAEQ